MSLKYVFLASSPTPCNVPVFKPEDLRYGECHMCIFLLLHRIPYLKNNNSKIGILLLPYLEYCIANENRQLQILCPLNH